MKMKTAVFAVALALSACLFAKEADLRIDGRNPPATVMRDWTPLSVTLVSPVALPPGSWNVYGLQVGGFSWAEVVCGVQAGFFNTADVVSGLQVGGVNVARQMYGVQIGFVNVIQTDDVPFLPILNWSF